MKKLIKLLFVLPVLTLCACSSNKNILRENLKTYPYEKYLSKVASAATKDEAKEAALAELRGIFSSLPADQASEARRDNLLALAKVAKTWKVKQDDNKRYYAMAVLERQPALEALQSYYVGYDTRIENLTKKLNEEQDKFTRLKYALHMESLLNQRGVLDAEYKILSYDATPYNEELLYNARAAYNRAFYEIKISSKITGDEQEIIKTPIIDNLNSLGFQVGENLDKADIELMMKVYTDKYESDTLKGLNWCTSIATVTLKDLATGGIFAIYSKTEKVGSYRKQEAQRRSLAAAGQEAALAVKQKVVDYLKDK